MLLAALQAVTSGESQGIATLLYRSDDAAG
jgi:hypothetical protein